MDRPNLPLNGLRAFEVAARQGSFTRAAIELRVTQAAVSQQIQRLEDLLGHRLFTRASSGLILTDIGAALHPVLSRNFDEIGEVLDRFQGGRYRETLHLGVVTTFAAEWMIPRLPAFESAHPGISLRIFTHNNRIDIAKEGLHMAIRFGDRAAWPWLEAEPLAEAPLTPFCAPELLARLQTPQDLRVQRLLRSYRGDEWEAWFLAAGATCPPLEGPVLDSSVAMAELAAAGLGVALLPATMFTRQLDAGMLARPFNVDISAGRYWLTWPRGKALTPAMVQVRDWLVENGRFEQPSS
ncbi:LysR family transcriptional regulator [Paracoccus aerius]|uniref:LysR family transcriptional regulator n=1 Tax=Paracoccus aerius TaxID=1915382 RepID=A0ABS1S5J1_9RHOB|nr:LysR family transcriptional regulator [Paracoccus aerius]MBL3673978.1 LysR family transcriptional regulator [Paracoccus aerius]GHG23471.1 LysR family transcriptional regulator [Paracoccus aerius]